MQKGAVLSGVGAAGAEGGAGEAEGAAEGAVAGRIRFANEAAALEFGDEGFQAFHGGLPGM